MKPILISGAGIAGLSLARQLKKLNIAFEIIEKRSSLFSDGAGIALPANAVKALRCMGLEDSIAQHTHRVKQIIYTDYLGHVLNQASLLEAPLNFDWFVALPRQTLQDILCKEIEKEIHFATTMQSIEPADDGLVVTFSNLKKKEYSAVIGADGIHSRVRELTFKNASLVDLGVTTWRWVSAYNTENLQPTYMLGHGDVFMAYPISQNAVYCYAHVLDKEEKLYIQKNKRELIKDFFKQYGGVVPHFLEILPENNDIIAGRLRSVSQPLFISNRVALMGDASHACSPMLQQGAALAFEDAIVLSALLKQFSIQDAFNHYENQRRERVTWVLNASDTPLKSAINIDEKAYIARNQMIREKGPLNVLGWRQLLQSNPIFLD